MSPAEFYPIYALQRHLATVWRSRALLPATTYRVARRQILASLLEQRRYHQNPSPF